MTSEQADHLIQLLAVLIGLDFVSLFLVLFGIALWAVAHG